MRKFITLGLTVAAVLATSAMTASAASAAIEFSGTSGAGPYSGHDIAGQTNAFTAFEGTVECNHTTTEYHGTILSPASTLTVEPTYEGCSSGGGTVDEVTMNECDYLFHANEKVATDHYKGTADLTCPEGQKVEVDVTAAGNPICTIAIPGQGPFPVTYTHETATDGLIIEGTLEGIHASRTGPCTGGAGEQTTEEATLHVNVTFNNLTVIGS